MIGIYMYENKKTHKKYIGQSTNIERRRQEHLKWPSKFSYFDNELQVIGEENFYFTILEECTVQELDEREKYWINFYDSKNNGYNLTAGGQNYRGEANPGAKLAESTVKKIIERLRDTTISIQALAKEYNVHYNTVSDINRCLTWNWLHEYKNNIRLESQGSLLRGELGTNKITESQAIKIINKIKGSTQSLASIAREFNIKSSLVYDINRCRTWTYLHNYKYNIRNESKLEKQ